MPAHVRGVLNLRGEILPLVDLRILFGMDSTPNDGRMLVVRDTTAKAPMALVVDRLSGLASLTPEELARKSAADHDPASSVLRGMVATGGRMVGLVDPERILTAAHGDAPVPKNRFSHLPTRGRSHV
jgi:purine-binding chemotaxis protein CheW